MSSAAYCSQERKPCVFWVKKYFGDCMCNGRDWFSFGFGIVSLVCWGVAEIPQIITNFRTKSGHGVSLAFLLTWVVGDVFNMVGCVMDPATLPTQLYTAELYTASTIILVLQGLYYDHFYRRKKFHRRKTDSQDEDDETPLKSTPPDLGVSVSGTEPCSKKMAQRGGYYFTSARSLAGSGTPPFRSYLRAAHSVPGRVGLVNESSSEDEEDAPVSTNTASQPRPIPRNSVVYGTFMAASLNLPFKTNGSTASSIRVARRMLLNEREASLNDKFGELLGWVMAAIYMGGRLPQIWLNIKRGSVEGLNPLMFIFALVANLAYVLSILIRSTDWESIGPNLPWLLDAAVCVLLDLFIVMQYVYYKHLRSNQELIQTKTAKGPKPFST